MPVISKYLPLYFTPPVCLHYLFLCSIFCNVKGKCNVILTGKTWKKRFWPSCVCPYSRVVQGSGGPRRRLRANDSEAERQEWVHCAGHPQARSPELWGHPLHPSLWAQVRVRRVRDRHQTYHRQNMQIEIKQFVWAEHWDVKRNNKQNGAQHMPKYYLQSITDPDAEFVIVAQKLMVRYLQLAC